MAISKLRTKSRRDLKGRAEALVAPEANTNTGTNFHELERDVYCVLGLPVDAVEMGDVLSRIDAAVATKTPFLLSTPNTNFLSASRSDPEFRDSLLDSDLCSPDGMPIVWIARLIGAPLKARVTGADIFRALQAPERLSHQLKVFFFGGQEGVAEKAEKTLNDALLGLRCVGTTNPGFGPLETMPTDAALSKINNSGADLLVASLGARKGQLWLYRNRSAIEVPVRAHFGAVLNFQAGTLKRAPQFVQHIGLEWLWRIKEEPHLWRRYAGDFVTLLRLAITRVLPLIFLNRILAVTTSGKFSVRAGDHRNDIIIVLNGPATAENVHEAISTFQNAVTGTTKRVTFDLSHCHFVDARFFGLFLMVRKALKMEGRELRFTGVSPSLRRLFDFNEVGFLLSTT